MDNKYSRPRLVLVGLGRFGRNHLRVLRQLSDVGACSLVGVVDIRKEAISNLRINGVQYSTEIDDLMDSCDAVDIVTPTNTHYDLARYCLSAGKDVFVEKPLATTSTEAQELEHLAMRHTRILGVGHILRYHPVTFELKSKTVKIRLLDGQYLGTSGPRSDSGVILNLGIHLVDLYSYLLNENAIEVSAESHKFDTRYPFEDYARISMKYRSGAVGYADVCWLNAQKRRELLIGGDGFAIAADFTNNLITRMDGSSVSMSKQVASWEPLLEELKDFTTCVRERRQPVSGALTAVAAIKTLEGAIESIMEGRPKQLDK